MTETTESLGSAHAPHVRIVGAVSAAHFVSHYYIILLAPLMPFVRAEYGVTYTEIGFAFAAFNVVSAALQTPAGFIVDRVGARPLLIGGLLLGAFAFIAAGLIDSFWVFVAMFAVAGIGNTVYHPADYAMLSQHVPARSIGQAFSVHTFAGMLGSAVAPFSLLLMQDFWGWRGAFVGAGILGIAVAALLAMTGEGPVTPHSRQAAAPDQSAWSLLFSAPIVLNLVFFMLIAITNAGLSNYSVVALGVLHGTPVATANTALTGFLLLSAIGVLMGGLLVARTSRHGLVTALGLAATGVFTFIVGEVDFGAVMLVVAMSLAGLAAGIISPSRDMIVREVTPPGSFGKVFGFVTTGFNIGGIIAPLIFGPLMDHGSPRLVFLVVAVLSMLTILTVLTRRRPLTQNE
ncbi:MFS transporter [Pseudolabrys taiwanensis]|nr:MFS transporter [Pseudolabrys taiwanensis]